MAFTRPTLQELITRIENDFKSGLGLVTVLRRSFLGVLSRVLAALAHVLFGFLAFIEKQAFPDTATDEYLERWAGIWGVVRKPATFAQFIINLAGTSGTNVPVGSVFRRSDGVEYTTDVAVTLTGSPTPVAMTAVVAGASGEVAVSDVITIVSPIAGLTSQATVTTIVIEPEDTEDDDSLRARLLDRIQNPPSGGAATDYIQWAREVAGITRAWVGPQALGPGTVVVYIVSDDEDPITPSPAKITEVFDYIDERRPVTANVTVVAPTLLPLNMSISIKPNNTATQNAIKQELEDLIFREASLAGAYEAPGELFDGKILLSRLNEAISIAIGEEDHLITLINAAAPADITPATGQLITLGTITWATLA